MNYENMYLTFVSVFATLTGERSG